MGPLVHQKEQNHLVKESKVVFWLGSQGRAAEVQVSEPLLKQSLRLPEWMLQRSQILSKLLDNLCNVHFGKLEDMETHHP